MAITAVECQNYDSTSRRAAKHSPASPTGAGAGVGDWETGRALACRPRGAMPITPFLAGQAFDPEVVRAMASALDTVSKSLRSRVPSEVSDEAVARKIIELAQRGVRGAEALAERARQELNLGE